MSHMKVPIIVKDMEKLACMNDQEKTIEQTFGNVTVMEDHNSIPMKDVEAISQRNWTCDKGEDNEDCTEFPKEIPSEMADLWHELTPLENKLSSQRMDI